MFMAILSKSGKTGEKTARRRPITPVYPPQEVKKKTPQIPKIFQHSEGGPFAAFEFENERKNDQGDSDEHKDATRHVDRLLFRE